MYVMNTCQDLRQNKVFSVLLPYKTPVAMAANGNGILITICILLVTIKIKTIGDSLTVEKEQQRRNLTYDPFKTFVSENLGEKETFLYAAPHYRPRNYVNKRIGAHQQPVKKTLLNLLISCGDVQTNPGPPRAPKYPCTRCGKGVVARSKAISCDHCENWTHVKCCDVISVKDYDKLVQENGDFNYICNACAQHQLPIGCLEESDDEDDDSNPPVPDDRNPPVPDDSNPPVPENNPLDQEAPSITPLSRKGLNILHLNVRSLRRKKEQVSQLAHSTDASIIALSETWLDQSVTDNEISIDGYNITRNDRASTGGGVCIYIKNNISYNRRTDLEKEDLEGVWIDICLKKTKPILICCLYRPPQQINFNATFEETLSSIPTQTELIILGDMNINLNDVNRNCNLKKDYLKILRCSGLKQIIDKPTRVTELTSTLIDHILVSNVNNISQCGVLPIGLSDHCAIYCTRKLPRYCVNRQQITQVRSYRNYSKDILNNEITNQNWDDVYNANDINSSWDNFEFRFNSIINKIAPKRQRKIKTRTEPWITQDILEAIHDRDKALRTFHQQKDNALYRDFCKKRNYVQKLVKEAKKNFLINETEKHRNDSKRLWKALKLTGYSNKNKQSEPIVLNIENTICYDPVNVSEHINSFFINVAQNIVNALPSFVDYFSAFSEKCTNFYRKLGVTPGFFKIKEVRPDYINKQLRNIKINKSTGLDDIGPKFLHDGADALTPIVTFLINLSISQKIVPNCTKRAKVTPIHKKNSKLEVGNYRPISILPTISKILEKAVHSQVEHHCKNNNLIYHLQSGFRPSHSTSTCLTYLHDQVRKEIEKGNYVGLIMLDVQKAFDSVNHQHLCEKIKLAGIEPDWFISYLQNRKQTVFANGVSSSEQNIKCGVPQGSILGPWCYLIYCNDLPVSVKSSTVILYADDTILLFSDKSLDKVREILVEDMSSCFHWLSDNRLAMHKGKTEMLVFSSKRKRHNTKNFTINHDGHTISPSKVVKYLGLPLNCVLSGEEIVTSVVSKVTTRLKFLYRHREHLTFMPRKILAQALILSHFDYSIGAWYMALNKKHQEALQIAQNKIVRFVLDLGPRSHIGQNELDRVGLLCVKDRARQLILHTMYDVYRSTAPSYLCSTFQHNRNRYCTRSKDANFIVPRCKTIASKNFNVVGAQEWNALHHGVKTLPSKSTFKKAVKSFLKTQAHSKANSDFLYY